MKEMIYAFVGNDPYLIDLEIQKLLDTLEVDALSVMRHDFEDQPIDALLQEITTVPFFDDYKVVICKNPSFLSDAKLTKVKDIDALEAYFNHPLETTVLILSIPYGKLDQKKPIVKALKHHAYMVDLTQKEEEAFESVVKNALKKDQYTYEEKAVTELISRVSKDAQILHHELHKLMLYAMESKHIDVSLVKRLTTRPLEDNIFELTNALLASDKARILSIYNDLMEKNEDAMRIISNIVGKIREIMHTKLLIDKGYTQNDIAQYFNVKTGRAFFMMKNAKDMSYRILERYMNQLADLDFHIKSGQIDKKLGLELFLLSH